MTTPTNSDKINKFRMVAALDTQTGRRDRDSGKRERTVIRRNYNQERGQDEAIRAQAVSPFDQTYSIELSLAPTLVGRDLLTTENIGKLLVYEGELLLESDTDRRYAQTVLDEGRRIRTITLKATHVSMATEDDQIGCDVWLQGRIAQPPRFLVHPQVPNVRVAATTLLVQTFEGRPNTRAFMTKTAEISIATPLDHPHIGSVLLVGNEVMIEGMLEIVTVRAGGDVVTKTLSTLEEQWDSRQGELGQMKDKDRFTAETQFRRDYQSRATERRTRVVVGFAELLEGRTVEAREAQEIVRRADATRRSNQDSRRRSNGSGVSAAKPTQAPEMTITTEAEEPVVAERPRRRRNAEATAVEATVAETLAPVMLMDTVLLEPVLVEELVSNGTHG